MKKITKDKYKEILEIQGISYNENSKWFTVSLNRINRVLTTLDFVSNGIELECEHHVDQLSCDSCAEKHKREDVIVWCDECYDMNTN